MSEKEREEKTVQQLLDEELDTLAQDLLDEIADYDITHSSVGVSKTPHDGVSVDITFSTFIREEYTVEAYQLTPLEQQISDLAKKNGFDFGHLISAGSGDGYTDWSGLFLGTLVGGVS